MSELTLCNYCSLKEIKRRKPKGSRVYLRSGWRGGTDVFVVPKGEKLDTRSPDDGNKHWVAWMMKIPEHCCC